MQELITPIDRQIEIDLREFVFIPKSKPTEESLKQLRYIKKVRQESKKEFYPSYCIEYEIAKLLEDKNNLPIAIEKIKQMQKEKGIIEFERRYITDILKQFSNLSIRVIQLRVKKILEQAQVREGYKEYRCLINDVHNEFKLKGEKTISKKKPIDRVYRVEDRTIILYSFI